MSTETLIHRVVIGTLAFGLLLAFNRQSTLALRLQILEAGLSKTKEKPETAPRITDEIALLRRTCFSLRGKVVESGNSLFCDLPTVTAPAPLLHSAERAPSNSGPARGGGVEVHYADPNKRHCTDITGQASCDVNKSITCPFGTRLIRVALTADGRGLRNRYLCN